MNKDFLQRMRLIIYCSTRARRMVSTRYMLVAGFFSTPIVTVIVLLIIITLCDRQTWVWIPDLLL